MAHIRFERVRDVIDAFPSVAFELDIEPSDEGSFDFPELAGRRRRARQSGRLLRLPAAAPRSGVVGLPLRAQVRAEGHPGRAGRTDGSPKSG